MLDIRLFRENPNLVRQSQLRRGEDPGVVDAFMRVHERGEIRHPHPRSQ